MSLTRKALLAGSHSPWLRNRAMKAGFVRRAVARFMPGETVAQALDAAAELGRQGASTIVTHLGENLQNLAEADAVVAEYLAAIDEIGRRNLPTQVSVKLTQLGLDHSPEACLDHLLTLAKANERLATTLWIDMESSGYVDATLDLYRRLRAAGPRVGVCLQAYLIRTPEDLESLLPLGASVRLVKGAYLEPRDVVLASKRQVDEQYFTLAAQLLSEEARSAGCFAGFGTHDPRLVARLEEHIDARGVPASRYEFEMLYGIQRGEQRRLVASGRPLRVLISYGESWFPWYMRRLAERPANIWFVAKNLFS